MVNVSTLPALLMVRLIRSDGSFGAEQAFETPALGFLHVTDIAGALGLSGDQENLRAVVSSADSDDSFFSYLSRIDNRTGDAVFDAAQ